MAQNKEAEAVWRQALDEAPRFVPGLAELADLLLNLGRAQDADASGTIRSWSSAGSGSTTRAWPRTGRCY
jgi:hypothetical protein